MRLLLAAVRNKIVPHLPSRTLPSICAETLPTPNRPKRHQPRREQQLLPLSKWHSQSWLRAFFPRTSRFLAFAISVLTHSPFMLPADKISSTFSCTHITSSICSCSSRPPCTSCGTNQHRTFLFFKSGYNRSANSSSFVECEMKHE